MFCEPGAGSDLAGVRTRAERDGDEWVVNGQKIWTSNAHLADWGVLIARTDPTLPKHKGLTFFIVDMKSPGIEMRPIKQLTGGSNFNEVFLERRAGARCAPHRRRRRRLEGDRVVPRRRALEHRDQGAAAADRRPDPAGAPGRASTAGPRSKTARVRERIASFYMREAGVRFTVQRMLTALSRNEEPGPEIAIGKLVLGTLVQDMTAFALELMHSHGVVMDAEHAPVKGVWQTEWLGSVVDRLGGGTDEIMRNVIGERILGLPEDVRVDKGIPFNQIAAATQRGLRARDGLRLFGGAKGDRAPGAQAAGRPMRPERGAPRARRRDACTTPRCGGRSPISAGSASPFPKRTAAWGSATARCA